MSDNRKESNDDSKKHSNQESNKGSNKENANEPNSRSRDEKSGGNAGAGRSGTEDLGSEKPTDGENKGSNKPGHRNEKS